MPCSGSDRPVVIPWEETAKLAYAIWEHQGREHGRDVEDWLEAERFLTEQFRRRLASS